MKVLIVGPALCGKDTACQMLAEMTGLRFRGSTSVAIGESKGWGLEHRRENRKLWFDAGRELCKSDPAFLVRTMLADADITNGCRALEEIIVTRIENLVDYVVWIERPGCDDSSLEFGSGFADHVVLNTGTLEGLRRSMVALARLLELPCTSPC